jgi:hypothetical protein
MSNNYRIVKVDRSGLCNVNFERITLFNLLKVEIVKFQLKSQILPFIKQGGVNKWIESANVSSTDMMSEDY